MAKLPQRYYSLALLIIVIILSGCELRRDSGDLSDPGPVSDVPPTLAPLGAETVSIADTSPPTTTTEQTNEIQVVPVEREVIAPADAPAANTQSEAPVVSSSDVAEASSVATETFTPPAEEVSAGDIVVGQEAIVVDASSDLPTGGPVAANPPASQTVGDYGASTYSDGAYTVQSGDTLFSIATRYGTTVQAIIYANGLASDFIYAGQVLVIPAAGDVVTPDYQQPYQQPIPQQPYTGGGNYHQVQPGETLYRIALQYSTSVDAIAGANGIPYPYIIQSGQQLVIPAPGEYVQPPPPPVGGFYNPQPYAPQPYQPDYSQPQVPTTGYYNNTPAVNGGTHTVSPGETLYSIALRYGTSAEALAAANGLYNPNQIYVGQVLFLP
jgi:LysM repeat protein